LDDTDSRLVSFISYLTHFFVFLFSISFKCGKNVFYCGVCESEETCKTQPVPNKGQVFVIHESDENYAALCLPMCASTTADPHDVIGNQCPCVDGTSNTVSNWVCMDPTTFDNGLPVKHESGNSETCSAVETKPKDVFGDFCELEPFDFENNMCPIPATMPPVRRLLRGSKSDDV
jgi:hypothetical protein